ncbi:hypothetical protein ACETU7_12315 [Rhodococcus sp. 3Y1]
MWQDMMLATLDPPDTDEFFELVASEVTEFLHRVRGNPFGSLLRRQRDRTAADHAGLGRSTHPAHSFETAGLISTVAPELGT